MSESINANVLKNFIVNTVGLDKLARNQAQKYDIDSDKFDKANENDNNFLELDEIVNDSDLYAQFATMYTEEMKEKSETEDEEKAKDEKNRVNDKSGAGAA